MPRNSSTVSLKQQRIAELARQSPQMGFTSLAYHLDLDWLREAYRRTRKDSAVGVDGQTAADYERDLEGNLQRLLDRAKSGTYRVPPVRRVHIPKGGSTTETRPIGIPTLEDKVLQRAVVMLLEPIYETAFHDGSYGFRPKRSAHQALESLWKQTMDLTFRRSLRGFRRGFRSRADHFAQPRAQAISADSATVRRTPARNDSRMGAPGGKVSSDARSAREKSYDEAL